MNSESKEMKNLLITLPERVDTFNLEPTLNSIREALEKSPLELTINLSGTRFVNLPFIKKLAQLALDAQGQGKSLVLLNASEKIKKQIGIFSDIKIFQIKRAVSKSGRPLLDESADF